MLTVADVLRRNARRHPFRLAVVDKRERRDHGELSARAWAIGRGLLRAGVRPGDPVGVLAANGVFVAEAFLGVASIGAFAAMYNWRWATPELVFALDQSRAEVVLVDRTYGPALEEALATGDLQRRPRVVSEGAELEAFLEPGGDPGIAIDEGAPLTMLYTGGTTGASKGVLLSHRNAMANAFDEIVDTDMTHDDRTLLIAPMFHSASLLCWFLPHMVLGASAVMASGFDEDEVAATIAGGGVTNAFLVPNMARRLVDAGVLANPGVQGLRRMYVGGAAFKLADKQAVLEFLPDVRMYYQYGLTEAGPIVTRLRPEDMLRPELDGSIGQEFLLNETRVIGDDGQELPTDEPGELWVRGPNVMLGYYRDEAATADVLRDGWLRTGDIVSRDGEGYHFFRDRSKDVIKSGGENVHSAEVEQVLYDHPAVREAAVLGVASASWDEEVCAVIVADPALRLRLEDLQAHCRARLAGYKVPKRAVFLAMEDMPISQTGKVLKRELQERNLFAQDRPASTSGP